MTEAGAEKSGGTSSMMAPELFDPKTFGRKDTRPTKRSDVYAMSMVMMEVCPASTLLLVSYLAGRGRTPPPTVWVRDHLLLPCSMTPIQVFTGRAPWGALNDSQISYKVTSGQRPARPFGAENRGLSNSVWDLIQSCWDGDRKTRPDVHIVHKRLSEAERAFTGNSIAHLQ